MGSIDIQDHSQPIGPDDVSAQSPVTPAQALQQIGHDRLFAAGLSGSATFVIDQASIVRGREGGLYGQMAVHLDVLGAGGNRAGTAEARVARQHMPGSESENLQTVLYGITKQMADAMNVELEYQMKRSLGGVMVSSAVVPSAVTAVPLGGGVGGPPAAPAYGTPSYGTPSYGTPSYGAPAPNALPPETGVPQQAAPEVGPMDEAPPGTEAPPPQQMSPPPGYLQLPSGSGQ